MKNKSTKLNKITVCRLKNILGDFCLIGDAKLLDLKD